MPNLLPESVLGINLDWTRSAGRLLWSSILMVVLILGALVLMRRPRPNRPSTWAESIAGAVVVFGSMLIAYGVIPHEWITFFDTYLQWTQTELLLQTGVLDIDKQFVRDVITVGIYVLFVGLNIALWVQWQKRPTVGDEVPEAEARTSRFGRPLRAKA